MKPRKEKRDYRLRIYANSEELGPIAIVEDQNGRPGPLEKTIELFDKFGFKPISARDWAYACIEFGIASNICQRPSALKEGAVYLPKPIEKIILVKETPIFEHPEYGVHSHAAELEIPVAKKAEGAYIDKINSKDSSVLEIPGIEVIKTKDFGQNKAMRYLFQDQVEDLGLLFDKYGVHEATMLACPHEDFRKMKNSFITQVWYGGIPANHAIISFGERNLHDKNYIIWGTKIPAGRKK